MRKKSLLVLVLFLFSLQMSAAEITSLTQVFQLGKGLHDSDGDGLADRIAFRIIIPDNPTSQELAVASDIAARANLESLVIDFDLVQAESDWEGRNAIPLFIGTDSRHVKSLAKKGKWDIEDMAPDQGLVALISVDGQNQIIVTAGSQEALLKTGRAFFLRWPYLWDVWGREEGDTYIRAEKHLAHFLNEAGADFENINIVSAAYQFPAIKSPHEAIKRLQFNNGEIRDLTVRISFSNRDQMDRAHQAFLDLQYAHKKGIRTDVLNYSGCRQTTIVMQSGEERSRIEIKRVGFPKRILTPSYKSPVRPRTSGKNYDLLNLFTPQGLYVDRDGDNHADGLETRIVIPQGQSYPGTEKLASRLVLASTGASFPIIQLETEIEDPKALVSPVLIGKDNRFNSELVKTAKLNIPPLEKGWGVVTVVPEAFNKTNALTIVGADRHGTASALSYLSQTFPYLREFKEGDDRIQDITPLLEGFLKGENGSAEAYLSLQLEKSLSEIKEKDFESVSVELFLPKKNARFEAALIADLKTNLKSADYQFTSFALQDNKVIFEKQKDLTWEKDEALSRIREKVGLMTNSPLPVRISVGLSESPEIRRAFQKEVEQLLFSNGVKDGEIEVLSSYKQGFFWLTEKVIPSLEGQEIDRLLIKFAEETADLSQPKRFYSEPSRWLQELYPVDEIIAQNLPLPLERIEFEMKAQSSPVYEVLALDKDKHIVFQDSFSPRTRKDLYLKVLPEWGEVTLTTGWVSIHQGMQIILDTPLRTDMERFWDFYQDEILPEVYSYILKKTGNEPAFSKQPYFKRLLFELWLSEPDYQLGLDEEIISSLESIHDEIYFDTLDFIRGITDIELEDEDLAEDSSRYSAPGNILPLIHASLEGQPGRVKVTFEDWQAKSPQLILKWKEKGRIEHTEKLTFPALKMENLRVPSFIYNGEETCIETLFVDIGFEKESEYTTVIDIIEEHRKLQEKGVLNSPFTFSRLKSLILSLKFENLVKKEEFPVKEPQKDTPLSLSDKILKAPVIPTDEIISPQDCLEIVDSLGRLDTIRAYIAGKSYENRKIPVLELFSPLEKYTSLPRLITFKPTLYLSGRQHANEISATNYILKFAELLASDEQYKKYLQKVNFILHPMENPDGAELAYRLQELTPFHSLHAGRYTSLGIDVGYQVSASKPLLPEAKVRGILYDKWLPDIYLNLHGYPSHEWVQQFSGYSPFLFRDYWIPRGWFAYYRSLSLPIYEKWRIAGNELKNIIIDEMTSDPEMNSSNTKFYDRYYRWATRWQPHMNYLEIDEGLNLYAKRRSSRASRLTNRSQLTFVEETPELMDETARGPWLDFLVKQGLTYLFAHVKYLSQAEYTVIRLEEEFQDRISIQFIRSRPGKLKNP